MAGGKLMLNIEKELFQWEKGRYVIVNDESITTVEFYNKKSKHGDEVIVENGQAQIPNKLLKESLPIAALACIDDENGTKVISRKTFKVLARPRPEFYVDDEDEPINPGPDIPGLDIIYDGGVVL
jgi:hypothetical protein